MLLYKFNSKCTGTILEMNRVLIDAELLVAAQAHVRMGSVSGTAILIAHKLEKDARREIRVVPRGVIDPSRHTFR